MEMKNVINHSLQMRNLAYHYLCLFSINILLLFTLKCIKLFVFWYLTVAAMLSYNWYSPSLTDCYLLIILCFECFYVSMFLCFYALCFYVFMLWVVCVSMFLCFRYFMFICFYKCFVVWVNVWYVRGFGV